MVSPVATISDPRSRPDPVHDYAKIGRSTDCRPAMLETQPRGGGGFDYAYCLMAIEVGTRWRIQASGGLANGREYTKIRAGITSLVTSLDDA